MLYTDTETADRIIAIMKEHPAITVKKIAQQLNLSVGGVRYHVNKMKKDSLVEHIGSSKKRNMAYKKLEHDFIHDTAFFLQRHCGTP